MEWQKCLNRARQHCRRQPFASLIWASRAGDLVRFLALQLHAFATLTDVD